MITRRTLLALGAGTALSACASRSPAPAANFAAPVEPVAPPPPPALPAHYGAITDEPYPIPAIAPEALPEKHWRREVATPYPGLARGTITVDPGTGQLFFEEGDGRATRYSVSVGAAGFAWEGTSRLQFWRSWPRWKVPASMIERKPELAAYSVENGGMDPGPDNPLGARALYLFQNGEDTLYRIHGDAVPQELGQAVSSGCIRMLDHDVIHLQERAVHGADVIVRPSLRPKGVGPLY